MLNTVILSDLHFGEPYSLVHDQGVPPVLNLIKAHANGRVRRLVLAGDIFEMSTLESMDLVRSRARFFLQQARSRFQIDQLIWVPGNHDYTLFRRYLPDVGATEWAGVPAPKEFIDEFVGDWKGQVRIAYPHLLLRAKQTGHEWVIHHGHYLDDLILGRTARDRARAWFSAFGAGNLVTPKEVPLQGALTLPQIEAMIRPVLEGIWCHHESPDNVQNEFWELVRRWDSYLSCPRRASDLVVSEDSESKILGQSDMDKAYFYLRAMRRDPAYAGGPAAARLTLITGHSHEGGVCNGALDGIPVRMVNLGGWIPGEGPTQEGRDAHTHVYMINDDLEERMLHAPFPRDWVQQCLDHGRSIFAIPGPDDALIARVRDAPPAPGLSVDEMRAFSNQHAFGDTKLQDDPFA